MDYFAAQNRAYLADNTETTTPGYTLFGAGIGADITNKSGKALFTLDISVNNITNVAYQSNMSRLKYMDFFINPAGNPINITGKGSGIYNMGRNIGFKFIIPLNYKYL